jgi:hypothetical protein
MVRRQAGCGAVLGIAALVLTGCGAMSTPHGRATTTALGSTATATGAGPGSVAASQAVSQLEKAGGWAVLGTFEMEGGPIRPGTSGAPVRPLTGVVMFRAANGRTTDITAGRTGRFAGYLPAGTYTVTARTEQIRQQNPDGSVSDPPCAGPLTVVVRPGQATRVALVCFVP